LGSVPGASQAARGDGCQRTKREAGAEHEAVFADKPTTAPADRQSAATKIADLVNDQTQSENMKA
jgi:hypothetical protein